MTGAYNFSTSGNDLVFRIKNRSINAVQIILDYDDTYIVRFMRVHGSKITEKKHFGIYCDMLVDLFESETGMTLHIPQIIGINA